MKSCYVFFNDVAFMCLLWYSWFKFYFPLFLGMAMYDKGPVIRAAFLFNLSRNIVALQVERVVARTITACSTCFNKFQCCS